MSPHLYLWAKLGAETWPEKYHPLICHLIDVAAVARRMWDDVLRKPMKERFAAAVGLPVELCGPWVAFWIGAHDIGKACPGFQVRADDNRMTTLTARLTAAGYDLPVSKAVAHATVSVPVLFDWLTAHNNSRKLAKRLAVCVGGHHGFFPPPDATKANGYKLPASVVGNDHWDSVRADLLAILAELVGVDSDAAPTAGIASDQSYLMVLAGLTTAADWVGSNDEFFPRVGGPAMAELGAVDADWFVRDYFGGSAKCADAALDKLGWLGKAAADGRVRTFVELFPGIPEPRPLQVAAECVVRAWSGAALVLFESPMGEGKTEAAQVIADACDRLGGQGCYYALPTMATSNGMYDRVVAFLKRLAGKGERVNAHLLHGQSLLSPAYEKLQKAADAEPFASGVNDDPAAAEESGEVVADSWFSQDKKHALLAPYGVGTIDQALLSVLQTKFGFLRLFALAGKCVVLDEVHAYDAYTGTLMEHLLKWLSALGCPVVLLSATLPRAKRAKFLEAYAGRKVAVPDDAAYPSMTVVRPGDPAATPQPLDVSDLSRKTIHLKRVADDDLPRQLGIALAGGGCAAVVRNTVGDAQATYRRLKDALEPKGVCVKLFHARFLMRQRQAIERNVLDWFGRERKPWPGGATKMVLVATQVVEQSLDLDFDLLVTDVAPVDLVLQRCGRLQRHRRPGRALNADRPTAWLIEPELADGLPAFGNCEKFYARFILLRSWLALRDCKPVVLPDDVQGLVESVYSEKPNVSHDDPAWAAGLADAAKAMAAKLKEDGREATTFQIREPTDDDDILGVYNQGLEEDDPNAHKNHRAYTRLAEPTVPLVVVYEIDGKHWLDAEASVPAPINRRPKSDDVKALLGNAVTLSRKGCVFHYIVKQPPQEWTMHGLLRFYRLVKVDATGAALPGHYSMRVTSEHGVCWDDFD